jgi:uncharacterized membrane protein
MPEMTLTEAAKWAGKGRPAILKAIQKGTLSARKDENQQWRIDPAELARVYKPGNGQDGSQDIVRSSQDIGEALAGKDRELALLREMLAAARQETADWKAQAAKWQEEAAAVRLLASPAPLGILARWFGR